jgi:hypothetical protein
MEQLRAEQRRAEEREVARDAQWLRFLGLPVLAVGIALVALDLRVLGAIAIVLGIGLMILDTGAVLVLSLVLGVVDLVRRGTSGARR